MIEHAANADTMQARATPKAKRSFRGQVADLHARYAALPRNQRFLVVGALALVGWIAADELLWAPARAWSAQSERIEAALDRGARRADSVSTDLRRSIATFGPVDPPGPAAVAREDLARAIDEVMRKHKVSGYSYETRTGQRVKDSDSSILGGAIDRLQAEVKFDTTADALPRIVAELEANQVIDGVTTVRLEKNEQTRKITVQATIECWVISAGGRGAR